MSQFDGGSKPGFGNGKDADIVCLSHLRWDFVFQRPQHLLTRAAQTRRVFYVEEPVTTETSPHLDVEVRGNVHVVVPRLPSYIADRTDVHQRRLIDDLMVRYRIHKYVLWYYTPMALSFTDHLTPLASVYDCMDELSAFKGASALLKEREAALMRRASLVFTGGQSLYEAKRSQHHNMHPFPSSVDVGHFAQARASASEPPDQRLIPPPRLGFFGVIDERMDLELLAGIAAARPEWHFIMVGPVVKIDRAALPTSPNIHYFGAKQYGELPGYISGWDVALLPFARNGATRFISPTKTPEYMAAGVPVVSTPIQDVVRPYGEQKLVRIAADVASFVAACEEAMAENAAERLARSDGFLRELSWDSTWQRMQRLVDSAVATRRVSSTTASVAAL